jgi:DNA-directed RNA polymerase specialized sigma subunit
LKEWDPDRRAGREFVATENRIDAQEFLRRLPAKSRDLVWKYHAEEMTFKEIGEACGVTKQRAFQSYQDAIADCRRLAVTQAPLVAP